MAIQTTSQRPNNFEKGMQARAFIDRIISKHTVLAEGSLALGIYGDGLAIGLFHGPDRYHLLTEGLSGKGKSDFLRLVPPAILQTSEVPLSQLGVSPDSSKYKFIVLPSTNPTSQFTEITLDERRTLPIPGVCVQSKVIHDGLWRAFIFPRDGSEAQALLRVVAEFARSPFGPTAFSIIAEPGERAAIWNGLGDDTLNVVRPQAVVRIPGPADLGTAISYMQRHPIRAISAGIEEVKRALG